MAQPMKQVLFGDFFFFVLANWNLKKKQSKHSNYNIITIMNKDKVKNNNNSAHLQ